MSEKELIVIGFEGVDNHKELQAKFVHEGYDYLSIRPLAETQEKLEALIGELRKVDRPVLVLWDTARLFLSKNFTRKIDQVSSEGVLFPASSHLEFDNHALYYYYWKHFPRPHKRYNFIDSSAFYGGSGSLSVLMKDVLDTYSEETSLSVMLNRYYADATNGCFSSQGDIVLDYKQEVFAVTQRSSKPQLRWGWMYELLYQVTEKKLLNERGFEDALQYPLNVIEKDGVFYQQITKTEPGILISEPIPESPISLPVPLKKEIRKATIGEYLAINKKNKWTQKYSKLFRYQINKAKKVTDGTSKILSRLEQKQPLSFAHYNDGELSFIKDYLQEKHHNNWYGRKQQQYDPVLAKRLHEAMQYRKEGYFVGVPCSVHHRRLRKLADKIVGDYEYKIQAMSIHHNLAYMPRLLQALKDREVYFFCNEFQDLSFFRHVGIEVDPKRVTTVPFKNSYLEYDQYAKMKFPKDAVVVLICGMLAKILTKIWYESHDSLTVLALGSSLDDQIQKQMIKFEPYPKEMPMAVRGGRPFLFGRKKFCRECYDI